MEKKVNRERKKTLTRKDGVKVTAKINALGQPTLSTGQQDQRLNARVKEKLRGALVAGNTYEAASRLAGIHLSTFSRWMRQGREANEGTLAREFYEFVELATTEAEHRNVMCIQKAAGSGAWQAAAWWLERRRPSSYSRREVLNIGNDGGPFEMNVSDGGALTDDEKKAALRAVIQRNPELHVSH